jgi:uncharacterized membrane protein
VRSLRLSAAQAVILGLCAVGIVDSAYLTSVHLEATPLVCTSTGLIDCRGVLHSSYASVAGIPVAVLGLVWFVVMAGLALRPVGPVALAWSAIGVAVVLWLLYVELFRLDRICLWCSVAHVLVVAIFAATVLPLATRRPVPT